MRDAGEGGATGFLERCDPVRDPPRAPRARTRGRWRRRRAGVRQTITRLARDGSGNLDSAPGEARARVADSGAHLSEEGLARRGGTPRVQRRVSSAPARLAADAPRSRDPRRGAPFREKKKGDVKNLAGKIKNLDVNHAAGRTSRETSALRRASSRASRGVSSSVVASTRLDPGARRPRAK